MRLFEHFSHLTMFLSVNVGHLKYILLRQGIGKRKITKDKNSSYKLELNQAMLDLPTDANTDTLIQFLKPDKNLKKQVMVTNVKKTLFASSLCEQMPHKERRSLIVILWFQVTEATVPFRSLL